MIQLDPRTMSKPVHEALSKLRESHPNDNSRLKEQKNQAVELYTYLSTWGMLRLKAEEKALSQEGKKQVVQAFFQCLKTISEVPDLAGDQGLETLKRLDANAYLGLTGLGLAIAQEFSFWATAVYWDIKGE
jgi:hypothetical protein